MPQATVYNFDGQEVGTRELPAEVFGQPVNAAVLHAAVVAQAANSRPVVAHTKTRGEVRGGGRKPWRQKGTGRARHGSIRSPIWIGGGIVFGPRSERNFRRKINQRVRRQALLGSLSAKTAESAIILVDDMAAVNRKTKRAAKLLANLKLRGTVRQLPPSAKTPSADSAAAVVSTRAARPKVLVVLPPEAKPVSLAFRNLPRVSVVSADSLNVADILSHRFLLMPAASIDRIVSVYGPKSLSPKSR